MEKKVPESVNKSPNTEFQKSNTGAEKTRLLSEKTKSKIWRALGIVGVGTLGAVGMAALGSGPLFAGVVGGVLGSKYQEKSKK